jgi:hypothetical protein
MENKLLLDWTELCHVLTFLSIQKLQHRRGNASLFSPFLKLQAPTQGGSVEFTIYDLRIEVFAAWFLLGLD